MIHLAFYVPIADADKVKQALFNAGAGRIGNYDHCCFETRGTGQFRPLENSHPTIGSQGTLEKVEELKVELVVEDDLWDKVREALLDSHPYETPAYYAIKMLG